MRDVVVAHGFADNTPESLVRGLDTAIVSFHIVKVLSAHKIRFLSLLIFDHSASLEYFLLLFGNELIDEALLVDLVVLETLLIYLHGKYR